VLHVSAFHRGKIGLLCDCSFQKRPPALGRPARAAPPGQGLGFVIVVIRWTGLAPWEFEFPFPGSLTSIFLRLEKGRVHSSGDLIAPPNIAQ